MLPSLDEIYTARDMISEFGGYNHNLRINQNEFYDMQNLSSSLYPVLSPRNKRGKVRTFTNPNGLFAHDKLCWVDGTDFYYDGVVKGQVDDSPKQFVAMGAFILIWPDKKYYNTSEDEFGSLTNQVTTTGTVTTTLTKINGDAYTNYSTTEPASPNDGDLWIDTTSTPHVLKQYSSSLAMWTPIPTTYVKISATGIGAGFSEYDGVTISGMENTALNGDFILYGVGNDYIIITAIIEAVATQSAAVTVERTIPDMDYLTESENRVWGCSSANHEIYACKLGDPKNWKSFLNISTDSYAMTVGSPGDFTGCCTHLGYVLFFKENIIHKIYGNKPANFQLTNTVCRGVEKGSEKSLVIVNETLFYKSHHDVCVYNAALPTAISAALGTAQYKNAVAGAFGSKYYISMEDDNPSLFVYDSSRDMWHREDGTRAKYFAACGHDLYYIADNCLYSVNGNITDYADNAELEADVKWSAETSDIGLELPDSKYISKLQFRMEVEEKAIIYIDLQYDHGEWCEVFRMNPAKTRSFTVPIIPKRCDTMRMRMRGKGGFKLYSLTKTIEQGSEL